MGRLGCNCGAIMSSVDCPSQNLIHIYTEQEVTEALRENPSIRLWDFRMKQRKYEYWFCTACHRVHQVDVEKGECIKRYRPIGETCNQLGIIGVPLDWQELYVITDVELDKITEQDFAITLGAYLPQIKRRVMISPDYQMAKVFDVATGYETESYIAENISSAI